MTAAAHRSLHILSPVTYIWLDQSTIHSLLTAVSKLTSTCGSTASNWCDSLPDPWCPVACSLHCCRSDSIGAELRESEQKLAVYGSNESNYYYQLQRFITDLKVLEDKQASKQ